jgi:hypothetical protein
MREWRPTEGRLQCAAVAGVGEARERVVQWRRERERENRVGTTTGGVGVSSDGEKVRWRRDDDRHEEKR